MAIITVEVAASGTSGTKALSDIRTLHLMCILVNLATSLTDLPSQFIT